MTTTTMDVLEAMKHLSQLLEAVGRGEEVVIARAGEPVATLSRYVREKRKILPRGSMADRGWWIADDFDDPVDDLFDCLRDEELEDAGS